MKRKSVSPNASGTFPVTLEEEFTLPINRCDPYNVIHVSEFSNTIAVGVMNGILFLGIKLEKPAVSSDESLFDSDNSPKSLHLFKNSLHITSAVEMDFQRKDPAGRYNANFIPALFGGT